VSGRYPARDGATFDKRAFVMGTFIEEFRENKHGFFREYRWFIVVFVFALFCDAASTTHFMLRDGAEAEIHPVIRQISRLLGPVAGPVLGAIGKTAAGIIVCILVRRFAAYLFVTASIISFWAAWYNIWGFKLYTPVILQWIPW